MFKAKSESSASLAFRALWPRLQSAKRGDVISYDEIAHITGVAYKSAGWSTIIHKLTKTMRRDLGMAVEAINGEAYRVLTVEEQQTERTRKRHLKMKRQNRMLSQECSIPVKELTATQRRIQNAQQEIVKQTATALNRNARRCKRAAVEFVANPVERRLTA